MQYNQIGNSDLKVSAISFGAMSLGEDQNNTDTLIHQAIDWGINYFDTADLYQKGLNEIAVGNALKAKRQKVIIATKVGNQWNPEGSGWNWNPSKKYIKQTVHESLRRLQTDYIDLYQLHGGTIEDPIDETIEAFEELKQQGSIRYYGISSIRPNVIQAYIQKSNIVSVMMQYSLLDRRPEENCLKLLEENNISVLARGGLAKGLLSNKTPYQYLNHSESTINNIQQELKVLSSDKRSPAQTALRYLLQVPVVASIVSGIRTMEQLEENVKTIHTPSLTAHELSTLFKFPAKKYEKHR